MERSTISKNGKPSISMGKSLLNGGFNGKIIYFYGPSIPRGTVSHNQRVNSSKFATIPSTDGALLALNPLEDICCTKSRASVMRPAAK